MEVCAKIVSRESAWSALRTQRGQRAQRALTGDNFRVNFHNNASSMLILFACAQHARATRSWIVYTRATRNIERAVVKISFEGRARYLGNEFPEVRVIFCSYLPEGSLRSAKSLMKSKVLS